MLRLERVSLREIRLPLREPFRISSGVVSVRRILLLECRAEGGLRAWSECVAGEHPNYSPETIDTAWFALHEWLIPRLLGRDVSVPEQAHARLDRDIRGHRMAKAALEMAVWELAARRAGVSLSRQLGGERCTVEAGVSLGMQGTPEQLAERAAVAAREGYRRIKVKIAPGADLPFVAAVREVLGPAAQLMVDANNAYTLEDMEPLARLDDLGLMMIEQPLDSDDLVRHAALQRTLRTPICLDESITSVHRVEDMIRLGSGRIVNIKPGRVGGFTPSRAIHDVCAAHGVPVWCGGMLESGIGRGYNLALATLPNFTLPGDLSPSARYWERDIVQPEWVMRADGTVVVPVDRPGIGVDVDENRVEDLTVRRMTLEA